MDRVLGLTSQQAIGFVIAGALILVFFGALAYISQGRRRARGRPDIPPAMQPGPSDPDLERPHLEKLQGWGVAFVLLFVVWIPFVWLREPSDNLTQSQALLSESIERGRLSVLLFSEDNQGGIGCVRCHGENPVLGGGQNLYNGVIVPVPDLRTVCGGTNTGHPQITNIVDVKNTIMQGRPNTDMPSWSVRYQGSLDDEQVQDILNYIVSIQDPEQVPFKFNVCINDKAKGYVAPVVAQT